MKILVCSLIAGLAAVGAYAQDTPQPAAPATPAAPAAIATARVLTELGIANSAVKNNPFTADETNESVQVLADGNRIVHNSTSKVYRNSEGRTRHEFKGGVGGNIFNYSYSFPTPTISIMDPTERQKVLLDTETRVARIAELNNNKAITIVRDGAERAATEEERAKLAVRLKELRESAPTAVTMPVMPAMPALATVAPIAGEGVTVYTTGVNSRYETKKEDLGTRDIGGVMAEGTKTTTIIPAGAIGNERPIEVVYERWFSKDLGVVVYSHRVDPRTGEQTYQLTNINRSEPDPALFNIPSGYHKIGQSGALYRTTAPARAVSVKNTPKAARP